MSDIRRKAISPDTLDGRLPFVRTETTDRKVRIAHFAVTDTETLLNSINRGDNYHVENALISEVEVIETRTIKLTRHEKLDDYVA